MSAAATWGDALIGRTLCGRYLVEGLLGAGGMGSVLRAVHVGTGRAVAVKVMRPELTKDRGLVTRFHQEARAAAAVSRRGVVEVLDLDTDPDVGPILVLELLEGESLHARIVRKRGLPPDESVSLVLRILETLAEVHAKGIVHRDIKPANVLLARDEDGVHPKLVDFGIARMESIMRTRALTLPGSALGTPRYMAPEQVRGEADIDARADLYGVGAILYFALAGRPPYADLSPEEALAASVHGPPTPVEVVRADTPPALAAFVRKAMARERADRFQSAREMRAALLVASVGPSRGAASVATMSDPPPAGTSATTDLPSTRRAVPSRRRGWLALGLALGAIALISTGWVVVSAMQKDPTPPPRPSRPVTVPVTVPPPRFTQADRAFAEELEAAAARAEAQLATGSADAIAPLLDPLVLRASHVTAEHPAADALAHARSVLALAALWRAPSDGSCPDRAAGLDAALVSANDQIIQIRALDRVERLGCALAQVAGEQVRLGQQLREARGRDVAACQSASFRAFRAAEMHARASVALPAHACMERAREQLVAIATVSRPAAPVPPPRSVTRSRDRLADPFVRQSAGSQHEVNDPWSR